MLAPALLENFLETIRLTICVHAPVADVPMTGSCGQSEAVTMNWGADPPSWIEQV